MSYKIKLCRGDLLGVLLALTTALAYVGCTLQVDDVEGVREVSLAAIAASCNIDASGTDIWISPNGSDANPGTFSHPKKTLQNVHDTLVGDPPSTNIAIHVDGGLYRAQTVTWSHLSPTKQITIEACPGAVPIFDGLSSSSDSEPEAYFFLLDPQQSGNTNVRLRNLTIRNYFQHGVLLNRVSGSHTTGNNVVEGCTLENIGSALWPAKEGISAVNCTRSSNNEFLNNRFVAIEDKPTESPQLHAIYCAHGSSGNIINGNSFDRCSGDPIKFRDGSNNNTVRDNSFNRCGDRALINLYPNSGEVTSTGNHAYRNVATFPHPNSQLSEILKCVSTAASIECPSSQIDFDGDHFFVLSEPTDEQIAAIAGGDFDDDGRSEILVAFNYDGQDGFAKIVSTAGAVDNRHLHRVIYVNDRWNISAMTSCDCNNDGDLELITALQFVNNVDWIYSGDGETYKAGLGSSFYSSTFWDVTAMAGGDYDGDGDDELITTFQASNQTKIYSGDGTTSPTNYAILLADTSSPYWKITAQTAGNFGGGNDELITAMNAVGSTSATYKVYTGNGVSTAVNTSLHSDTTVPYWQTTATIAGDFNDDGTEELITGMYRLGASPSYKLYIGNGTSTVANVALVSSSSPFFIRAAGAADYDGDGDLDLITAIESPGTSPAIQILVGNGVTSHDDLGTLYSSTYMD